jgi:hypothetical protein
VNGLGPPQFSLDERLELRKPHACGGSIWRISRLGADIGLTCERCGRRLLLPRSDLERLLRRRPADDQRADSPC